jgi:hypothetical protein
MFFDRLKSAIKTPEIEFLCEEEDFGAIPKPYPARKLMPDWYKALPQKMEKQNTIENGTLKRCPPFLDAMCVGWIIPLAADVQFKTNHDASGVEYRSMFYKSIVENHNKNQITTKEVPNPREKLPPLKFLNWWGIRVPKGYSVLFVPPLNRPEHRFTVFSGLVDCDGYNEFINFPFQFNIPNFVGIIEAGTPLVQAIPIRRDAIIKDGIVNKFDDDYKEKLRLTRNRRAAHESIYRDYIWERK